MASLELVSVGQLASAAGVSEGVVREWARTNDVSRVGSVFVFTRGDVESFASDLEDDEEDILATLGFPTADDEDEDTDDEYDEDEDDPDDESTEDDEDD